MTDKDLRELVRFAASTGERQERRWFQDPTGIEVKVTVTPKRKVVAASTDSEKRIVAAAVALVEWWGKRGGELKIGEPPMDLYVAVKEARK